MIQYYIKTKNNFYLVSESTSQNTTHNNTLVIERGAINKFVIPFKNIKEAQSYINRISKYDHMKKFLPLSMEKKINNDYQFNLKWYHDKEKNILSIDTLSFDDVSGSMFDIKLNDKDNFENVDNIKHLLTSGLYKIKNKKAFFKILNDYLESTK